MLCVSGNYPDTFDGYSVGIDGLRLIIKYANRQKKEHSKGSKGSNKQSFGYKRQDRGTCMSITMNGKQRVGRT